MMIEKPKSFDQLQEDHLAEQLFDRVPDALEIATREAARRQARQLRQMSHRDRYERSANGRTARRRERSC
jgi:hypothetical protein